jgi:hypothetical protein
MFRTTHSIIDFLVIAHNTQIINESLSSSQLYIEGFRGGGGSDPRTLPISSNKIVKIG